MFLWTTYYLNPRYQYRSGIGDDGTLIHAVHNVYSKLDPASPAVGQFGNEVHNYLNYNNYFVGLN